MKCTSWQMSVHILKTYFLWEGDVFIIHKQKRAPIKISKECFEINKKLNLQSITNQ